MLRDDISRLDRLVRNLRTQLHRLTDWIIAHMRDEHEQSFDPADVYGEDHDA